MLGRRRPKKLSILGQRKVIQLFNNLFASGFHLAEIVDFLQRSQLLAESYISLLRQGLTAGKPFSELLSDLSFSDAVVTQVSLAEIHGNTALSLQHIEDYLAKMAQVRKKLIEVATYPIILLAFLMAIMLGLKNYLLPQLEEGNLATTLVNHFPQLFLGGLLLLACFSLLALIWVRKTSKIKVARVLSRLPFLGNFVKIYLTAYYAREWGSLIGQGLELGQIVTIMQEQPSALFQEIGRDLAQTLTRGQGFCDQVLTYPFFRRELSLIIEYGQVKSKLGAELSLYADECWEEFFSKINRAMQLIQPLVFLFVALMIVLIYAAMLLPIYQNMEI